jgi:hypothetical protein
LSDVLVMMDSGSTDNEGGSISLATGSLFQEESLLRTPLGLCPQLRGVLLRSTGAEITNLRLKLSVPNREVSAKGGHTVSPNVNIMQQTTILQFLCPFHGYFSLVCAVKNDRFDPPSYEVTYARHTYFQQIKLPG